MDKKEQARIRKQRQRDKERDKTVTDVTLTVTKAIQTVTPGVTAEHPILEWLIPGEKRFKLEKIVKSLRKTDLPNVYLGCRHPIPSDVVCDMLGATEPSLAKAWKQAHPELDQYGHPVEVT